MEIAWRACGELGAPVGREGSRWFTLLGEGLVQSYAVGHSSLAPGRADEQCFGGATREYTCTGRIQRREGAAWSRGQGRGAGGATPTGSVRKDLDLISPLG